MVNKYIFIIVIASIGITVLDAQNMSDGQLKSINKVEKVSKTDREWKEILSPEQYTIARKKGTEAPFSGVLWDFFEPGYYECVACGSRLFGSDSKFRSGCGWPSFFEPGSDSTLHYHRDTSHGMVRTEVTCAACDSHLGHVFEDGPPPTGLRYCINSVSLRFIPANKQE